MINAVIFDLDNTLLDFMNMKNKAVEAAINGMIEAGLSVEFDPAFDKIFEIYESKGWEYQEVFDEFIKFETGSLDYKILASGIVAYRKAKEASLILYPNVNSTLITLSKWGLKLGVVSDAPSREAWMRICSVNLHHIFDAVVTFHDTGMHKPSPEPFKRISTLLDIPPENSLMIGDWPERDVIGAKKVGMKTAFAKYGDVFGTEQSGADYDIMDIKELLKIIYKENNL
ncbi:MAG: HAD-IA family hydrolase [Candidatus Marinimicrobia bacterium]|nr:HAD-IA family hydrolase [Candidatus Neomarinimicrobiota bacterium]